MANLKQTPLYPLYEKYGAKTIDFGGFELPVQFSGIKAEHDAVRTKAGIFDVSHMGEIEVKGDKACDFLQYVMTNDVSKLQTNQLQYTAMCNERGGTIDDLIIYKRKEDNYLLVVNAANIEKDLAWLKKHQMDGVAINDLSSDIALIAIQGPLAEKVLQKLTAENLSAIRFFTFKDDVDIAGKKVLLSRSGYTGEDGFEIYCQKEDAAFLWEKILEAGTEDGVIPCGLGARDTLRFEARLPLYGQELDETISPLEAGIGFAVKLDKEADFIGKEALRKQKEDGLKRKLVGLEMIDRGIPRHGYEVFKEGKRIGHITTGTQSPTLKKNIGLALIESEFSDIGTEVEIEIRGKRLKAKVVPTPFYKKNKKGK